MRLFGASEKVTMLNVKKMIKLEHLIQPVIHLHFTSVSPGALVQVFDPALIRKIIFLCHIAPSSTSSLIKSKANGPGDVNMLLCRRAVMLKIMHQRDGHARNAAE